MSKSSVKALADNRPSGFLTWDFWHQEGMMLDDEDEEEDVQSLVQQRRCISMNSINSFSQVIDNFGRHLSSLLNNTRLTRWLKYSLGRPPGELLPLGLMGPYPPSCLRPLFPTHHLDTLLPISYSCVVSSFSLQNGTLGIVGETIAFEWRQEVLMLGSLFR